MMQSVFLEERYMPMYKAGWGGTSHIYAAFDTRCRELVAIKRIFPEAYDGLRKLGQELLEEISVRAISHPNLLRLLDRFWYGDSFCMVTEFIWGLDLENYLYRRPLNLKLFVELASQMLSGLNEIHRAGYLHGDIKPQNMMLHFGTDSGVSVKILDFGLADLLPEKISYGEDDVIVNELFATPEYVAPELIRGGTASHLSDLYGLGQTFFHCLTGEASLVGENPEATALMQMQKTSPSILERRVDMDAELAGWIDRFLAWSPCDRWQSSAEALGELESLTGEPSAA